MVWLRSILTGQVSERIPYWVSVTVIPDPIIVPKWKINKDINCCKVWHSPYIVVLCKMYNLFQRGYIIGYPWMSYDILFVSNVKSAVIAQWDLFVNAFSMLHPALQGVLNNRIARCQDAVIRPNVTHWIYTLWRKILKWYFTGYLWIEPYSIVCGNVKLTKTVHTVQYKKGYHIGICECPVWFYFWPKCNQ